MNILSTVMAFFSILGAIDRVTGNRLGIGKEFERGVMLLGTLTFSMVGMLLIAPLFAKLLLPSIEKAQDEGDTILDGLYSWSEYKCLKEHFGDRLIVAAVITNRPIRYERLTTRKIRPLTNEEALSRDLAEIEKLEKGGPIAMADYFILNNGDVESLCAQVDEFLSNI